MLCAVNWVKHALRWASGRVWPAHTCNREHRAPTRNPCERAWESDANGSNWPGPPCRAGCLAAAASELTRTWHRPRHPLHLPWRCEIGAEAMRRLRRTPATGGDLTRLANGCAGGSIRGGTSLSRSFTCTRPGPAPRCSTGGEGGVRVRMLGTCPFRPLARALGTPEEQADRVALAAAAGLGH